MYLSFFQLKELPFNLTPDPRFLFMSRSHREAFDHLLYGIHQRRGFIEVVGGIGTGKTTLCRALLEEFEGKVSTALIFNAFLSEVELLKAICDEFRIPSGSGSTRKELIDALNGFLIEELARGGNACLILDECQNLQVPVLEQIRMLSNLETDSEKLLQIVMVGQPEFHDILKSPPLRQLDERINVRSFLEPLDEEDTHDYISHRLTVAGAKGDIVFTQGALKVVYDYSQGIPRRINTVCDRCLLIAYTRETFGITGDIAREAIQEVQGRAERKILTGRGARATRKPSRRWAAFALLGALSFVVGWIVAQRPFDILTEQLPMEATSSVAAGKLRGTGGGAPAPQEETAPPKPSMAVRPADAERTPDAERAPEHRFFPLLFAPWETPEVGQVEVLARDAGLESVRLVLSWQGLVRFRRSCLLELLPEGATSPRYAVLRGISERGAWLQENRDDVRLVSRDVLGSMWFGGAWIFIPPAASNDLLRPQNRGEAVERLQEDLARLGYWKTAPTGLYDERTKRAVMALQRDLQLPVDGVAGRQTRGVMLQLLTDAGGAL